jgi:GDPmannose 4,6-dehydratase
LLKKQYEVVGLVRRTSTNTLKRLGPETIGSPRLHVVECDLTDPVAIIGVVDAWKPQEIYNLAAQSHVATSFTNPAFTFQVDAVGVLYLLEAMRKLVPESRFYQASTSEMFGKNFTTDDHLEYLEDESRYQDEQTVFAPQSPYAIAKVAAHNLVTLYRDAYNLHASCGILFNHESERRGELFVTRKITKYVAGLDKYRKSLEGILGMVNIWEKDMDMEEYPKLKLGNLDSMRDWGYAPDYVEAMWLMLQQEKPGDYVIATGESHTIREFLDEAFKTIGISDWSRYVEIDPTFVRPAEVEFLLGRANKAKKELNWKPKTMFHELVEKMVYGDIHERLPRPTV